MSSISQTPSELLHNSDIHPSHVSLQLTLENNQHVCVSILQFAFISISVRHQQVVVEIPLTGLFQ